MRGTLLFNLIKACAFALIAFIFAGAVPTAQVVTILGLFVALRFWQLGRDYFRKEPGLRHWDDLTRDLEERYAALNEDERVKEAAELGLDIHSTPREMAQKQVRVLVQAQPTVRPQRVVMAEVLGLISYVVLLPLVAGLYASDFFSLRRSEGLLGIAVILLGILLYWWPHLWKKTALLNRRRMYWWGLPFVPALFLVAIGIQVRHPYLNPLEPERMRLAAERVLSLSLRDGIVAAQHADWVLDYAHLLHEQGNDALAEKICREALRMDAGSEAAGSLLRELTGNNPLPRTGETKPEVARADAYAPYWTGDAFIPVAKRGAIDEGLENVDAMTVVIVPVGEVPNDLLDAVADVIQREISVPCIVATESVPLPVHTRVHGLIYGKQWDAEILFPAFKRSYAKLPKAPVRYLLITAADIYAGKSNYVFAQSYNWGVIASYAQYVRFDEGVEKLRHRTAKLCLGSVIKCFGIQPSVERTCVTSYTRSVPEFDSKGNRPSRETLAALNDFLRPANQSWLKYKAQRAR